MFLDELYQRERHADFVREAEHAQLLRDVEKLSDVQETRGIANTRGTKKSARQLFYRPALSAVGVKLVDLGVRLQGNVENPAPPMFSARERA